MPEPAFEAAWRGLDAVLAGHTHGGQVRLPGGLALLTRSRLGPHFDRGLFDFAAPNARGWTRLVVNSGVGTSLLPVRFLCPPSYAVVEVGARSRAAWRSTLNRR
jgi:predicted MPP superfamily phosphohydrolase